MRRIIDGLFLLFIVLAFRFGVWAGVAMYRYLDAPHPPDAYPLHEPIPEIYRVTWKDGELRT